VLWGGRQQRRVFEGVSELSFEPWHQAYASVLIRHPYGELVVDPSFSERIAEDLKQAPPWFHAISGDPEGKRPISELLLEAGVDPRRVRDVLLTHAHWDHAGGVRDMPNAKVRMSTEELQWIWDMHRYIEGGTMPHHLRGALRRVRPIAFDGPPLLRFEASADLFGDGSIIAVPLFGHTPGSTGYLLRGRGGRRWLMIGDAAWALRGVEKPAHKTVRLVDSDQKRTAEVLGRLHALMNEHPEITIVPAHDAVQHETMPKCEKQRSAISNQPSAPLVIDRDR
jgi:glyoxylase-like metal-dependent hydrolase (beta-lactamase superfamily II)